MKAWTFRAALVAALLLARATWGAESQEKQALETWWKHFDNPRRQIRGSEVDLLALVEGVRSAAAAIAGCNSPECTKRKDETLCLGASAIVGLAREWQFYAEYTNVGRGLSPKQLAQVCPLPIKEAEPWWAIPAKYAARRQELGLTASTALPRPTKDTLGIPAAYYLYALADVLANCGQAGDALEMAQIAEPLIAGCEIVIPTQQLNLKLKDQSLEQYIDHRWVAEDVQLRAGKLATTIGLRNIQKSAVLQINPMADVRALEGAAAENQARLNVLMEAELEKVRKAVIASANTGISRGGAGGGTVSGRPFTVRGSSLDFSPRPKEGRASYHLLPGLLSPAPRERGPFAFEHADPGSPR